MLQRFTGELSESCTKLPSLICLEGFNIILTEFHLKFAKFWSVFQIHLCRRTFLFLYLSLSSHLSGFGSLITPYSGLSGLSHLILLQTTNSSSQASLMSVAGRSQKNCGQINIVQEKSCIFIKVLQVVSPDVKILFFLV